MIDETIYFLDRQGEWYLVPKEELKKIIDPFDESTFLPHLKNMNYPYLKEVWEMVREKYVESNKKELTFGRYLAMINLKGYRNFTWENTNQEE